MTAPNIEMIADSLRSCSLNCSSRGSRPPPPPPEGREEAEEVTVELNSEVPLPYHWEQCLDLRTGQIYYRNWLTTEQTTEDPRLVDGNYYYSSAESDDSSDDEDDSSNDGNKNSLFSGDFSTGESSTSSAYSAPEVTSADPQVLVAAGCKFCFMYFMVPKQDAACPKCGRLLLHLGRSGSSCD